MSEEVDAPDGEEEVAEAADWRSRRPGGGGMRARGMRVSVGSGGAILGVVVERFVGEARRRKRGGGAVGEGEDFGVG